MIRISDKSQCTGCGACSAACPRQCIRMVADEEGFRYPQVDRDRCVACGVCERICPVLHANASAQIVHGGAFAARIRDDGLRLASSSGGLFTAIAEKIIDEGGVVFGAAFDKALQVVHVCAETKDDLSRLRGSKYVQSEIGATYQQAKTFLQSGRKVLFTGTPCQIGGLYAYLGGDPENLLTQDIICHGVPSPMVWQQYLAYRQKRAHADVRYVSFRHKKYGWKTYAMSFDFANGTTSVCRFTDDPYMQAFLKNLSLRPSCYACAFKQLHRQADVTLADFWGVEHVRPEMDDDGGTSLLIVHSEKGERCIRSIEQTILRQAVDLDVAIRYNTAATTSVACPAGRQPFMQTVAGESFEKAARRYCKDSFANKVKRRLRRWMGRGR